MKTAIAKLKSVAPYSQTRPHETPKLARENPDDYERRTWRERAHVTPDGRVFMPPMAFKMCLDTAAKMLGMQIPGKGKATYTKYFLSGVLVTDPVVLPVRKEELRANRIFANVDGIRGSGKKVWRILPAIDEWEAEVAFYVIADEITRDVFEKALDQAGKFVGVGQFRPERGGYYGRFSVEGVEWREAA